MAAPQPLSKTSYDLTMKLRQELKPFAGECIPSMLNRYATSGDTATLQQAFEEFQNLVQNFKELSESYPKEQAARMNVPIRGIINLNDKVIIEYEKKTASSLVKLMRTFQDLPKEKSIRAAQELQNLILVKLKLEQLKMGSKKTGNRPVFTRVSSKDTLGEPSRPPQPATSMDTSDKSEGKKAPLPLPQSMTSSMLQGREMAHMPMIEYQQMVRRLESQQRDIDEMTSRLSRFASNQVTQGNPNIADLSDKNRPTKIGEKFGELYDYEWSEAFESFKVLLKIENEDDENQIISQLLRIVQSTVTFCTDVANEQLEQLKRSLQQPIREVSSSAGGKQRDVQTASIEVKGLDSTAEKYARNFRKECALKCVPAITQLYKITQIHSHFEWARSKYPDHIDKYIEHCVELVWLMSVQDPPMFLSIAEAGEKVRTDLFTYYGHKGKVVSTTVWPAVLLHKDGPIISKGYVLPQ
ncbi:uncharacterized protein LOC132562644 [Ylistrum balloti]|uniref:uncharacterized protein LOC132562644 n=1 Tax=Ylistrum balloti TaxID=509963 RepID=UPI0029059741|nr:uncharacterized protein LOC132562644 [Ylistrum balloti]